MMLHHERGDCLPLSVAHMAGFDELDFKTGYLWGCGVFFFFFFFFFVFFLMFGMEREVSDEIGEH